MSIWEFVVFLVIMVVVIRPLYAAYFFVHPPRFRISFRTPADFAPHYEAVNLTAADGTDLDGWYIPSQNGAAVILLHGHGGNRLAMMFHAEVLARRGFGVLLFDLRAHGSSRGRRFGFSPQTVEDVLTAVAYLTRRDDVKTGRIGAAGVSVGGTLALHAAARTVAIQAVWADGPAPATPADAVPSRSFLGRLYNRPLQAYYWKALSLFGKTEPLPAMATILPRLAPRPLQLVAAGDASEQRLVSSFLEMAAEPKAIWTIPQASHASGWFSRPEPYAHRLAAFFDAALLPVAERQPLPPLPEESVFGLETAVPDGYTIAADVTITLARANLIALMMIPFSVVLLWLPYWLLWRGRSDGPVTFSIGWMVFIFIVAIVVHELLHAIGFVTVGKAPLAAVKFGVNWRALAPYAHCRVPMTMAAYRLSTALPGVALGLLPGVIGLVTGQILLIFFGVLMLVAAGGDAAILWVTRHVAAAAQVLDHPTKAGCLLVEPAPSTGTQTGG